MCVPQDINIPIIIKSHHFKEKGVTTYKTHTDTPSDIYILIKLQFMTIVYGKIIRLNRRI